MSLLPKKYDKYVRFFTFVLKYRNSNIFIADADNLHEFEQLKAANLDPTPEELVKDLKAMGPTYVKLGQLLSTRPDMIPDPYLDALAQLQDEGDEIPYEDVEQLFREEIGQRISKAFASFNKTPLASASIGQVHEARLHSGKKVAVKIQRPNVRKRFVEDLDTLMTLSEKAEAYSKEAKKFSIHQVIDELRYILLQELDYTKEAQNLIALKENLKEFKHLVVPGVIPDYYSQRVLTMEYVSGQKVTAVSSIALMDMPSTELADDLVKAYLKQIIVDGFAHADPHPGNVHLTKDHKLALIDLGMVARFSEQMQDDVLKIMMALGSHDGDRLVDVLLSMSTYNEEEADIASFKKMIIRKVQENQNSRAEDLQTGQLILQSNQIAANNNIRLPAELSVLGKILLNMDQIVAFLAPEYNLEKTVRNYIDELMRDRLLNQLKSNHLLQTLLESKELTENLPYRLNKITENLANDTFKFKIDAFDEHRFIVAFQKVANRITIGIVIASLIVGAAMLMRIPTTFTIIGYPGFAIILFVFAASIGLYLIYKILFTDVPQDKDRD